MAAQAGIPENSLRITNYHTFAPRAGLAWRLSKATVVRAAYGVFFVPLDGNRESEWRSAPFIIRESGLLNPLNASGIPSFTIHNILGNTPYAATPNVIAH